MKKSGFPARFLEELVALYSERLHCAKDSRLTSEQFLRELEQEVGPLLEMAYSVQESVLNSILEKIVSEGKTERQAIAELAREHFRLPPMKSSSKKRRRRSKRRKK